MWIQQFRVPAPKLRERTPFGTSCALRAPRGGASTVIGDFVDNGDSDDG